MGYLYYQFTGDSGSGAERKSALRALLVFSLLSAIYPVYLGVGGGPVGPLLWPAAALHAALAILLVHPFERAEQEAGDYDRGFIDHIFVLVPARRSSHSTYNRFRSSRRGRSRAASRSTRPCKC